MNKHLEYWFHEETGAYRVAGNTLTVTPRTTPIPRTMRYPSKPLAVVTQGCMSAMRQRSGFGAGSPSRHSP